MRNFIVLHFFMINIRYASYNFTRLVTRTEESNPITSDHYSIIDCENNLSGGYLINHPRHFFVRLVIWLGPERLWPIPELIEVKRNLDGGSRTMLTCKSLVRVGYSGERPIEQSSSWFLLKFPPGKQIQIKCSFVR